MIPIGLAYTTFAWVNPANLIATISPVVNGER